VSASTFFLLKYSFQPFNSTILILFCSPHLSSHPPVHGLMPVNPLLGAIFREMHATSCASIINNLHWGASDRILAFLGTRFRNRTHFLGCLLGGWVSAWKLHGLIDWIIHWWSFGGAGGGYFLHLLQFLWFGAHVGVIGGIVAEQAGRGNRED